jgi:hypothetical protein
VSGPNIGDHTVRHTAGGEFFRQVSNVYHFLIAHDKGTLNDVFQLPYITGPLVGHKQRKGLSRDPLHGFTFKIVEAVDELFHQQRDVLLSPPQWGQFHPGHVDPVVKILPEFTLPGLFGQVPVGSDDNPSIR